MQRWVNRKRRESENRKRRRDENSEERVTEHTDDDVVLDSDEACTRCGAPLEVGATGSLCADCVAELDDGGADPELEEGGEPGE